jgi:hypothetical protein
VCDLRASDGSTLAAIVYPGTWFTLETPAELACRYFDPDEITVPADPTTLETAVRASIDPTPYADAVAAAIDPANWEVGQQQELTVDNLAATAIEATATADGAGVPVGTSRLAYLVDVRSAGTLMLWTTGTTGDEVYATNAGVVTLMMALSSVQAPS